LSLGLPIIASEGEDLLVVVNGREEVAESWHLGLISQQFLVVEYLEIVVGWAAEKVILVGGGDEDD
jgi:hypothetical protein